LQLTPRELAFSRRALRLEFFEACMAFASPISAISLGLRRQRIRALVLRAVLMKAASIIIRQRMAAARDEIERGRERLWLGKPSDHP
jgi:hypothetical protein